MGFSLNALGQPAVAASGLNFALGGNRTGGNATEALRQFKTRIAGNITLLTAQTNNIGTGKVLQFRKNGANGNNVINPTDTTAGTYKDSTHSDALVSGDLFNLQNTNVGTTPTYYWATTAFKATSGHASFYTAGGSRNVSTASTTFYNGGAGENPGTTTESITKFLARTGFTLQNAQMYISTARATNSTVNSRIDTGGGSANGTITYTLTASTTGLFEDAVGTDTINAGDYWNWAYTLGTGADTMTFQMISASAVSTAGSQNDIFTVAGIGRAANATPDYRTIPGGTSDPSEALRLLQHGFPVTTTKFRVLINVNSTTGNATATLRKNSAAATQTFTITAATSGWFEDASHSDAFAATDTMCAEVVGGTANTFSTGAWGLLEVDATVAGGASQQLPTMGVG